MTERVETVKQLIELLSKQDPNKPVKVLVEEDNEEKFYALYVEQNEEVILFK